MQQQRNRKHLEPIAVIGVGTLYPGSNHANGFWNDIVNGKDLITEVPSSHWLINDYYDPNPQAIDKTYCKRGAFLKDYPFDYMEFGIPPNILPVTDTSQLLALIVAKEVLQDTKQYHLQGTDLSRVSVILGAGSLEALQYMIARMQRPVWKQSLLECGLSPQDTDLVCDKIANYYVPWQEATFPGLLGNVVAGRVANRFNLGGTNCVVDAACATSLAALSMAFSELQLGHADMVITGGVDTLNDINMFMCFSKVHALSREGDCRPFSASADGTVLGEGVGMLALKRLSDAEKDGNQIYALIRGVGTSSDGRSKSIYAPLAKGQSNAIVRAYEMAGYGLDTVELIEAHGTGTKAGDVAEFNGLNLAFSTMNAPKKQYCALGSVKSQVGHTKGAAGSAGLFKTVMALHHKILPPTIKVDRPNPALDWNNSPFYLNTKVRPWVSHGDHPRRAGVSSFGFGGSNFHVTLEEYQGSLKASRLRTVPTELIILSAEHPQGLLAEGKRILTEINEQAFSLSYLAYHTQTHLHPAHLSRLAIVAKDQDDFSNKLRESLRSIESFPTQPLFQTNGIYYGHALNPHKVAFLFPGQGSQYLGMGGDIAMSFSAAMDVFENAAHHDFKADKRLHEIIFPPPVFDQNEHQQFEKQLTATEWAQPALAATSLALLKLIRNLQIDADCVAGHSFGELTALCSAGVMDESQLLASAHQRGLLMKKQGIEAGVMISIHHTSEDLIQLIKKSQLPLTLANYNSPKQIVLSGSKDAMHQFEAYLKSERISYQYLPVANAFHSSFVTDACAPFEKYLSTLTLNEPRIPVYANTTAEPYPNKINQIKKNLAAQLAKPVLFQQQIEAMYLNGVRTFIEVGPKTVLTNLVKQCLAQKEHYAIALDRKNEHGVTALWHALAQLTIIGLNPLFNALWDEYRIPQIPEAIKNPKHLAYINGTSYGKLYPVANNHRTITKISSLSVLTKTVETPQDLMEKNNMSENNQAYLIQMYQELQKQLVDAHNTYQKSMAESHIAFLNSVGNLAHHITNQQGNTLGQTVLHHPTALPQLPVNTVSPAPSLTSIQTQPPLSKPSVVTQAVPHVVPIQETLVKQPTITQAVAPSSVMPLTPPPQPSKPESATIISLENNEEPQHAIHSSSTDIKTLLLNIVVEKTGYPIDMLKLDMDIEADLGIDSIKRVEILSALTESMPNLPVVSPDALNELRTLGDIMAYIEKGLNSTNMAASG